MQDYEKFREQWKAADKMFRLVWWKRPFSYFIYRKAFRVHSELANEVMRNLPKPPATPVNKE